MASAPRIFISTGELSGDYHASNLVRAIRKQSPDATFLGVGSHNMKSAGVDILYDSSGWGGIGIWQGLRKGPAINRIRHKLIDEIPKLDLDLIIVVDYRVFHAALLDGIRHLDVSKMYYFAPVVWPGFTTHGIGKLYGKFLESMKNVNPIGGKGTINRFESLSELADKLIVAYPFALDDYLKAGADVEFLGHPLMNAIKTTCPKEETRNKLGLDESAKLIGIFPGSRDHELVSHLPVLKKVIAGLKSEIENLHLYMPIAHPDHKSVVTKLLGEQADGIRFVSGEDYDIFNASDIALSKTGTSVQVLMALGVPTVAFYTVVSSLWYNISIRFFVKFEHIAFPNVLAGKRIIPEFIQDDFKPDNLLKASLELLADDDARTRMTSELLAVRDSLYKPDALEKAAAIALELAWTGKT